MRLPARLGGGTPNVLSEVDGSDTGWLGGAECWFGRGGGGGSGIFDFGLESSSSSGIYPFRTYLFFSGSYQMSYFCSGGSIWSLVGVTTLLGLFINFIAWLSSPPNIPPTLLFLLSSSLASILPTTLLRSSRNTG